MELEDFLSKLEGVRQLPSGFAAQCPSHDDHVASLSVNAGREGGIVVHCHAGCLAEDVVAAVGLTMRDLAGAPHIAATYSYNDEDGRPLWRVERWANPKTFRCVPGLPPAAQRRLYRSETLPQARLNAAAVFVPEGEKDCDRLAELGLVATTNVGGASAWLPHYATQLANTHVVVIADNDEPGRKHARQVAASCATTALSVAIVVARYGKDVSELLDLGWTLDALDPLPEEEELGVICAANVRIRQHEWAWPGYIPLGAVSIMEGDPGDGKSITSIDLAARWSSGAPLPDGSRHDGPYSVVMISAEDDPEATIAPRLRAAGADMNRIFLVTGGSDPTKPFTLTTDMAALARFVISHNAKVITLDPLMAFVADETDSHNDHSVRRALHPLYRLAQDTMAAVLVIRHLNKGGGKAVYRGGGSIAFIGAARAAYTIGKDSEDPNKRIMACVKMNIAVMPPSLSFSVDNTELGPFLKWHGVTDSDAQDVLDGRRHSESAEIIKFLNTVVEDEPLSWKEIARLGEDIGYTEKMLRHRRDQCRLMKIHGTEGNRSVRWGYLDHAKHHLPEAPPPTTHLPEKPLPLEYPHGDQQADDLRGGTHMARGSRVSERQVDPSGQLANDLVQIDDDQAELDRLRELEEAVRVCSVCGSADAYRFAHPHWTIRCLAHDPETYAGE